MQFPTLTTDRLILRQITEADQHDIYQYLSDEEVMRHYGMPPLRTAEDALGEIDWYRQIFTSQTGIRWGITFAGDNRVIGSCGFHQWDKRHHRIEIGYELARPQWGLGIMAEALRAALHYGFTTYQVNRIQALVEPENRASIKLVKKLGFTEEGLLKQYEYTCGKFDDLVMLALLKGEFAHHE